jgi:hypothetical protein
LVLFPILLISKWLFNNSLAFNLWLLGLLIICKNYLINGSMDSLLAIYIASGCLLITKIYSNTKNKFQYYFPLILILGSLPLIKNEGLLATLIFNLLLIPRFNKETIYVALSMLSISIYLLFWKYPLILNNIHSELFSSNVFSIITERINKPDEIILIFKSIFKQLWVFLLISVGLLMKYKKIEKITLVFLFFIFSYLAAIFIIYMLSPYELSWHLNTSIKRTMLPVKVSILSMLIFLQFSFKSFFKG